MLFDGCACPFRKPVAQGFGNIAGKPAGRPAGRGTCAGSAHATVCTRGAGAFTRAPLRPSSRSVLILPTRQPL